MMHAIRHTLSTLGILLPIGSLALLGIAGSKGNQTGAAATRAGWAAVVTPTEDLRCTWVTPPAGVICLPRYCPEGNCEITATLPPTWTRTPTLLPAQRTAGAATLTALVATRDAILAPTLTAWRETALVQTATKEAVIATFVARQTAYPTSTPRPTAPPAPTRTPRPSPTPVPPALPVATPVETAQPAPTHTPLPTATATATPPPPPAATATLRLFVHSDFDPDRGVYRTSGTTLSWPAGETLDFAPAVTLDDPPVAVPGYRARARVVAWSIVSADGHPAQARDSMGRDGCRLRDMPSGVDAAGLEGCVYRYRERPTADEMRLQGHVFWTVGNPLSMCLDVPVYDLKRLRTADLVVQVKIAVTVINTATDTVVATATQIETGTFTVNVVVPRSAR